MPRSPCLKLFWLKLISAHSITRWLRRGTFAFGQGFFFQITDGCVLVFVPQIGWLEAECSGGNLQHVWDVSSNRASCTRGLSLIYNPALNKIWVRFGGRLVWAS